MGRHFSLGGGAVSGRLNRTACSGQPETVAAFNRHGRLTAKTRFARTGGSVVG